MAEEMVRREEVCSLSAVRRIAAMLDQDPDRFATGAPLPRGWQFILMAADTQRAALRTDGFPGLGVPMPALGLDRLMLGSRRVALSGDIPIGAAVTRHSVLDSLTRKDGRAGPMAIATIAHRLYLAGTAEPVLVEFQTYVLLPAGPAPAAVPQPTAPVAGDAVMTVRPDDTAVFQYSALGFNSHRIHLDRNYAQEVEGFPDLVVNGGLIQLWMTEVLRTEGIRPASLTTRHTAPLFCGREATLTLERRDTGPTVRIYDDAARLAASMEVVPA